MAAYKINIENTGLDTDEQVQKMADLMQADGHNVEFTRDFGLVQDYDDETGEHVTCPVSDQAWMRYLEQAAA